MWELDYKESWVLKNWCFWTVVLKTLESPLDCKEIKPVHPKGNQSWIFIGRTDAEAETPILWPPDVKNWFIWKDLNAGKDWRREKGTTGWDGWMASPTQWTWVWVSLRSWWWTGRPGVLQSMGSPRVGHDRATEQQQLFWKLPKIFHYSIPHGQWHQENYQFEFFSWRHSLKPSFSHGNCLHSAPHAQISLGLSFPVILGILFIFVLNFSWVGVPAA